jgi:hypothetical protein
VNYTINPERLAEVMAAKLDKGAHEENSRRMCVMEAVAYVAGEQWSDSPQCACPVISTFLRAWNDALPDDERTPLLADLIPRLVGTRSTKEIEIRRGTMAADWMIRVYTPAWLRLAKLDAQAAQLESLPEITDFANCPSLMPVLNAVRSDAAAARAAAGDAAGDAARDAARDAAWAAAGAAARDAAGDAAGDAARDAARDAAWDAARAAARAAAGAAARDAAGAAARDAAGAAARAAAWAAAGAAAGDAAWAAAWDAARAAAWDAARDAAGDAAGDAAWDAAWAAARDALNSTKRQLQASAKALVIRVIEVQP